MFRLIIFDFFSNYFRIKNTVSIIARGGPILSHLQSAFLAGPH